MKGGPVAYKTFVAGEEALAADVNSYLMSQTVSRFASASARSAAVPAPVLNQVTVLDSNPGGLDYWNGSAWVPAPGGAWTAYTPTLVGDSASGTIGNGLIVGRWKWLGEKTVAIAVKFQAGSTTTYNAGAQRMSLPQQANGAITNLLIGPAAVLNTAGIFSGYALAGTDRNYMSFSAPVSTTNAQVQGILNTHLNASSLILCSGTYEVS